MYYVFMNIYCTNQGCNEGKLIAVVYTLRTYGNQFSLGGIYKQE